MNTPRKLSKILTTLIVGLSLNLSACGYILYPERQGQTSGKLDSTIVIMDAIGLLFYVVPGVVAFAVDISQGTIYLAPGEKSAIEKHRDKMSSIETLPLAPIVNPDNTQLKEVVEYVSAYTGKNINIQNVQVYTVTESSPIHLAELGSFTPGAYYAINKLQ